ncbi:MAG: hypothetical protein WAL89_09130 [Candidatus Sulfotelmatobacter sp.]
MKTVFANGKPVDDKSSRVCVLFDPKDGRVVHVHGATTIRGGKQFTDSELEKDATEHAKAFGHLVTGLKALHVPVSAIRERGAFKVNAQGTEQEMTRRTPLRASEFLAKWRDKNATKGKK